MDYFIYEVQLYLCKREIVSDRVENIALGPFISKILRLCGSSNLIMNNELPSPNTVDTVLTETYVECTFLDSVKSFFAFIKDTEPVFSISLSGEDHAKPRDTNTSPPA